MLKIIGRLFLGLLTLCVGCSLVDFETKSEFGSCNRASLVQAILSLRGTHHQIVKGSWQQKTFSFECVIQAETNRFTAVFLSPMMRLATLTLTSPVQLDWSHSPTVPNALQPECVLFDLAFVNLSPADFARAISSPGRVIVSGENVKVYFNDTLYAVRIAQDTSTFFVTNHLYGYSYTITDTSLDL